MSTRTNILLATEDGLVRQYYIHYDGYPEGVGCQLVEWLGRAYLARNAYELKRTAAEFRKEPVPDKRSLQQFILSELESHDRSGDSAGPGDLLEPEEECDAGVATYLHCDIEFLYLLDMRESGEEVRLICRNVRNYEWKQTYIETRQSYRTVMRDVCCNGAVMASFSYRFQ